MKWHFIFIVSSVETLQNYHHLFTDEELASNESAGRSRRTSRQSVASEASGQVDFSATNVATGGNMIV